MTLEQALMFVVPERLCGIPVVEQVEKLMEQELIYEEEYCVV